MNHAFDEITTGDETRTEHGAQALGLEQREQADGDRDGAEGENHIDRGRAGILDRGPAQLRRKFGRKHAIAFELVDVDENFHASPPVARAVAPI